MGVKAGYKQTEVGVIPEDWDCVCLGDIGDALIGLTYRPDDVCESGTLVLRSSNIQDDKLAFRDNVFVSMEVPDRIRVRAGDVLICVRNGSRELIGKSAYLDRSVEGMTFGAFMAIHRGRHGKLVSILFQSNILRRQIGEHLGATINQITNKSLKYFQVPLPREEAEQSAIPTALGDVDALLAAQDALIAKKRAIKQGAMQELLTGKRRLPGFSGEWEVKPLSEIGVFLKGSGVRKDEAKSGELPCVRYGEIYTQHDFYIKEFCSLISQEVAATATRLVQGDLLFAGSGETKEEIGKCIAFQDDLEAYAGGDIVILRPRGTHPIFMGYACNQPAIQKQKASKGQGDAVVHIGASALADIEVLMPSIEEQAAIAEVLSDMDTEITVLETQRAKTAQLKQGMMQALLTGRIRLV